MFSECHYFSLFPPGTKKDKKTSKHDYENMTGNENLKCEEIKFMVTNIQLYTTEEKDMILTLEMQSFEAVGMIKLL